MDNHVHDQDGVLFPLSIHAGVFLFQTKIFLTKSTEIQGSAKQEVPLPFSDHIPASSRMLLDFYFFCCLLKLFRPLKWEPEKEEGEL